MFGRRWVGEVRLANHEVVHAVGGVELHNVPEDRPTADLHHGLGLEVGFFGNACAEAAGEHDSFHEEKFTRRWFG